MGWIIYLIGIVDGVNVLAEIVGFISLIGLVVCIGGYYVAKYEEDEDAIPIFNSLIKYLLIVVLISLPIGIFIPDSKTIAAIYLIPKIAENEQIQKLPNKTLELLNFKLDEWIKDAKGK